MDYTKEFGRYVKACRKQAGISQEELAEKCDMSTRQISNIETGRCEPKLTALSRLCISCGIEFDKFIKDNTILFQPKLL
ncbi:MAG: helix-turn-helix transcriptional regulator [Clostridia bacterium]|nr:helix-turn-helix transcriptional regulator [Clostridia bacterium]